MRNYAPDTFRKKENRNAQQTNSKRSGRMVRKVTKAEKNPYSPPLEWHEPTGEKGMCTIIQQPPGEGYMHVVKPDDVQAKLDELPNYMTQRIEVIQLTTVTEARKRFPCYGMQWGRALYLFAMEEELEEKFGNPIPPNVKNEVLKWGAQVQEGSNTENKIIWTLETIRDYYLNNVLIHEIGHLIDERNTNTEDRERYANSFADQFGYNISEARQRRLAEGPSVHTRRHHST